MSRSEDPVAHGRFGAGYWEGRYRDGEGAGRRDPSPSLVTEAGALPPGRALDAGCGRGADAVWLASRGWHVTAVDVSGTAVSRASEDASAAGREVAERIEWVRADLTTWEPGERAFDLVTSHYVHAPGTAEDLFRRLASWVAPGGTLLVVGHGDSAGRAHAHAPGSQLRAAQVTAALPGDRWEIVVAEARTHVVQGPDGAGAVALADVVVRARRTGPSGPGPQLPTASRDRLV